MSIQIYYFSGSGNSLHAAREIQRRIPATELIPIVSLLGRPGCRAQAESVGFVFPQYASTLPKVMAQFIRTLDVSSAAYLFALATRGGTDCLAFDDLDQILSASGRGLDAFFVLNMPSASESLIADYSSKITPENTARLEAEMQARLASICQTIASRSPDRSADLRGLVTLPAFLRPLMPVLRPLILRLGKRAESTFAFYSDEKCSGCAVCEKVCLARRVRLVSGRPVWQKEVNCYGCFACLNFCPEQSVQIRSTWYLKSHTPENGRYHHPQITAKDIAAQKSAFYQDGGAWQ